MHKYTVDNVEFIKQNCKGRSVRDLTLLFNSHFSLSLTLNQIKAAMANHSLRNERDTGFKPGHVPANKGKKGTHVSPGTQFKPGHMPVNYRPVGSERKSRDGYIEVKVRDPKTWAHMHRVIWEKKHGPVPKGNVVIFANGDKLNLSLDNLLLVSRRELAIMNHEKLIYKDKESTRSGQLVAALKIKITDKTKRKKR